MSLNLIGNFQGAWSNTTSYQINVIQGAGAPAYFSAAIVKYNGGMYILNGSNGGAPSEVGITPDLDSAWTDLTGSATDVLGTPLTGLVPAAGTIVATDTILQGFNKAQGNFNGIGSNFVNITPTAGYSDALSTAPVNLVLNTNTLISASAGSTVLANNINLAAGHLYVATVSIQADTFSATSVLAKAQWNVNSVLQPNLAISSAGGGTIGNQAISTCLIDTRAGSFTTNIVVQTTSGTANLSFGSGIWVSIYSII
jgi:hypothetical protein